ncbi:hypothetical protein PUN28_011449 [Cardiocondyla obscurior]|uniref:Ribosomal protein S10 n=1 Tax=Cardiocondyla obscurior TaxID=286306 RepID=A0AAW2FGC8_9HYME
MNAIVTPGRSPAGNFRLRKHWVNSESRFPCLFFDLNPLFDPLSFLQNKLAIKRLPARVKTVSKRIVRCIRDTLSSPRKESNLRLILKKPTHQTEPELSRLTLFFPLGTNRKRERTFMEVHGLRSLSQCPTRSSLPRFSLSRAIRKLYDESPGIDTTLRRKSTKIRTNTNEIRYFLCLFLHTDGLRYSRTFRSVNRELGAL